MMRFILKVLCAVLLSILCVVFCAYAVDLLINFIISICIKSVENLVSVDGLINSYMWREFLVVLEQGKIIMVFALSALLIAVVVNTFFDFLEV